MMSFFIRPSAIPSWVQGPDTSAQVGGIVSEETLDLPLEQEFMHSDPSNMTMLSSSLFVLATLIIIAHHVKPYPHLIKIDDRIERRNLLDERCRVCGYNEDCFDEPAGGCVNGVYKDKCGYINCFKGPGEHCDKSGRDKCAPNLLCKCKVCKGCQKNRLKVYQCFYGEDKMCLGDLASEEKF